MKEKLESMLKYTKYTLAGIGAAAALYVAQPAYAQDTTSANGPTINITKTVINGQECVCTGDVKDESNCKPVPAPQPKPKPKGPKGPKGPKKDDCYNLETKLPGAKDALPMENPYGEDGKCSYRAVLIKPNTEYLLMVDNADKGEYFTKDPVAVDADGNAIKDGFKITRRFYDSKGRVNKVVFKVNGDKQINLQTSLINQYGVTETDDELELKMAKEEKKVEAPVVPQFTPVAPQPRPQPQPQPKPVEPKSQEPSWLAKNANIAAEGTVGYVQSTRESSSTKSVYQGIQAGATLMPSLRLNKNLVLDVYAKYLATRTDVTVNGESTEGADSSEDEFGAGAVMNFLTEENTGSRMGNAHVGLGVGYLGQRQDIYYPLAGRLIHLNGVVDGVESQAHLDFPRLAYTSKDVSVGLDGGAVWQHLTNVKQSAPGIKMDKGTKDNVQGYVGVNATFNNRTRLGLDWVGTSQANYEDSGPTEESVDNSFGSHLRLSLQDKANGWVYGGEAAFPYGPENDEYGAAAFVGNDHFRLRVEGKHSQSVADMGDGQTKSTGTNYVGANVGGAYDFDMAIVKGLNWVRSKVFRK